MIVEPAAVPLIINHDIMDIRMLRAGDHIYVWKQGLYSHHGIYIGDERVVHFIGPKANGPREACRKCGFMKRLRHGVVQTCLDCFLLGGLVCVYRYGVSLRSRLLCSHLFCNACTDMESKPDSEVVDTAKQLLIKGFGTYDFLYHNCEDFATFCKTGTSFCLQRRTADALTANPSIYGTPIFLPPAMFRWR